MKKTYKNKDFMITHFPKQLLFIKIKNLRKLFSYKVSITLTKKKLLSLNKINKTI